MYRNWLSLYNVQEFTLIYNVDTLTSSVQDTWVCSPCTKNLNWLYGYYGYIKHGCMYKRPYFSTGGCKPELLSIIVCCYRAFNAFLTFQTTVETSNGTKIIILQGSLRLLDQC